jgi:hypothetical protein
VNIAPEHEAHILAGARSIDDDVARDRFWIHIADAIRTLRTDQMNERGLKRAVAIAVNRAHRECATCGH